MSEEEAEEKLERDGPFHYRTVRSKRLSQLRGSPTTSKEDPNIKKNDGLWDHMGVLKRPSTSPQYKTEAGVGRSVCVYYLWGDERRAVRRFIKEHREFVAGCMERDPQHNKLQQNWGEGLYQLLKEEWQVMEYEEL